MAIPRMLRLKYSTLGHSTTLLMRKEGNVICLLVRKRREQLSYAAVNRSIMEKAVCFAVSLNGADSGANRSEQLSKGTFLKQSPKVREPRTFHTKLMHSVVYSCELSQPRGFTIPNHNEICIIRQSQDQSQMIVRMTTSLLQLVACVDYQPAQDLIDPENLSTGWFCLANIHHSFRQQHLTFNYSWLCYL